MPVDSTETAQTHRHKSAQSRGSLGLHASVPHLPLHPTATSQIVTAREVATSAGGEAPIDSIPKQVVTHCILNVWMGDILKVGTGTEPAIHAGQSLLVHTNHVRTLWRTGQHLQM